jgi:hypothetical protein
MKFVDGFVLFIGFISGLMNEEGRILGVLQKLRSGPAIARVTDLNAIVMLDNNPIRKGTVEHLAWHELLKLHLRQQLLKHLLHHFLLVPILVDNVLQHTGLPLRNGLYVIFETAETSVAVGVVGFLIMHGLL